MLEPGSKGGHKKLLANITCHKKILEKFKDGQWKKDTYFLFTVLW